MPQPNTLVPALVWGVLHFSDGTAYQLTSEDVLWAARSLHCEGGPPAANLWTLSQRFTAYRQHFPTFTDFIQNFSQCVNPDWIDGRFCGPGGSYEGRPECSEQAIQVRQGASSISWAEIAARKPEVTQATMAWAQGRLKNPVLRSTNWAAPSVAQSYLDRVPGASIILKADNWYLVEPWAQAWKRDHVRVHGPGGRVAGTALQRAPGYELLSRLLAPINPLRNLSQS